MAFIEKVFQEGSFLDDLVNLATSNGWEKVKKFQKAGYSLQLRNNYYDRDSLIKFGLAEHTIIKNVEGTMYGLVQIASWDIPKKDVTYKFDTEEDKAEFIKDAKSRYSRNLDRSCFYIYMIEKEPVFKEGTASVVTFDTFPKGLIDVEVSKTDIYMKDGDPVIAYTDANTDVMMSPFVKITLRNPNLQGIDVKTNWWPDSLVRVTGQVDKDRVVLLIQADNTPAFENNVVPVTPLYMGKIESYAKDDQIGDALWAGTAFDTGAENSSHAFDFNDKKPYRNVNDSLPILKTYPKSPGNGIDNVIIKRSRLGARYQAHYIAWNVAPNEMPPDRKGVNGGQYPLAWQSHDNDEYKYQFNPSVYSGRVHTSRAYVVHPDEGVRGFLPHMVLLSPLGLLNGDKLKVRKNTCPDTFDIYRFYNVDAISPITKRPATPYRPAGLGIYEKSM